MLGIYLDKLDGFFSSQDNVFYQRYKDDIILLTGSGSKLQWMKDALFGILRQRKLAIRFKKTFEGLSSSPVSYLGFRLLDNCIGQSRESKRRGRRYTPFNLWEQENFEFCGIL